MDRKHEAIDYLKENKNHGDVLLPFEYYRCTFANESILPIHWHEEAEITLIQEGSARYTIDFNTYEIKKGDLILISPHVLHSAQVPPGETLTSDSYVFHLDMLSCKTMDSCTLKYLVPLQKGTDQFPPIIKPGTPCYEELVSCIRQINTAYRTARSGYELILKQALFQLFYLLYDSKLILVKSEKGLSSQTKEKLKYILAYIEDNYEKQLTIEDLASLCHFSKCHFMNFFKKYTGMTCMEYIIHYRLSMIAAKLQGYAGSITDLAMDSGFNNISYFNRAFRKKYGTTPKRYAQVRS